MMSAFAFKWKRYLFEKVPKSHHERRKPCCKHRPFATVFCQNVLSFASICVKAAQLLREKRHERTDIRTLKDMLQLIDDETCQVVIMQFSCYLITDLMSNQVHISF